MVPEFFQNRYGISIILKLLKLLNNFQAIHVVLKITHTSAMLQSYDFKK